jgi:uncharacterized YigZ family protein
MSSYKTISALSTGKYIEKGSRFIAYASHILTEKEALDFIEGIRKEHHKARHVCFAYTIGTTNEKFRVNDDGEPANTAGQPILNQIKKYGLQYVVIAVVRYFGGVLLGKGGLIQAYGKATSEAIETAKIIDTKELVTSEIDFHISHYVEVMEIIKKNKLTILNEDFDGEKCTIKYQSELENIEKSIKLFNLFY